MVTAAVAHFEMSALKALAIWKALKVAVVDKKKEKTQIKKYYKKTKTVRGWGGGFSKQNPTNTTFGK